MRNKHTIDLPDWDRNEPLKMAIEILESYEKEPIEEFERMFAYAKIDKKQIRMHLDFMRRMRQSIDLEMDDFNDEDYILVHKQSLIDAFNGKPPKWLGKIEF